VTDFKPLTPDYETRVRDSFARQPFMDLMGARIARVSPGHVEIDLPFKSELTQQHGFIHGGAVGAVADSAAGYAAFSLMDASSSVLTVEYKINLVRPAEGEGIRAIGRVVKAGRQLMVCSAGVVAYTGGEEREIATALFTMMVMAGRSDAKGLPGGASGSAG